MTCIQKQQAIPIVDLSESILHEEKNHAIQDDEYDKDARKYRKYLAQQEALRDLEHRKTHALVLSHKVSFFR